MINYNQEIQNIRSCIERSNLDQRREYKKISLDPMRVCSPVYGTTLINISDFGYVVRINLYKGKLADLLPVNAMRDIELNY